MSKALYLVTFKDIGTGQIQILRTGAGFWRWDHGAPFAIDEALLATILRNTRLRARPLRVDVMHWSNGDMGEGLEDLVKAGEVDPNTILMMPWSDPATGSEEWGLFCPVVWTDLGASAAHDLDEISPVIEWEYVLPFDVLDEEGKTIPAGTCLGPTITGISLVDQGFFWMDKVRVYQSNTRPLPFLFQEKSTMTPEQLAAFLIWAQSEGWDQTALDVVIKAAAAAAGAAAPAATPEAPDMAAGADPAAAAEVMAARAALTAACKTNNAATIMAAQKAYGAAVAKTKKPAVPTTLAGLVASLTKKKAAATPTAAPAVTLAAAPQAAAIPSDIQAQLDALKAGQDQILIKELEREGLLLGIDDPMALYAEAPGYFMKRVNANVLLAGSGAPAGSGASPLRALKVAGDDADDEGEAHNRAITAYREAQKKGGRILTYAQAMTEWEAANPGTRKKKTLL